MDAWPELPYDAWAETCEAVHLWTQVVGKLKLALAPPQNQWWQAGLHLTGRGLTTGLVPWRESSFAVDFDFVEHALAIHVTDGRGARLVLEPMGVADFHRQVVDALAGLGIDAAFSAGPAEIPEPVPFAQDTRPRPYDRDATTRWWRAMVAVDHVAQAYRTRFRGKASPILFYWGGMDLNHTRFTGRRVDASGRGAINEFAEDEENFAVGFWPGSARAPEAVLYAYGSPAPDGVAGARVEPEQATWSEQAGFFALRYADARRAADPAATVRRFFESAYEVTAGLAGWDRSALEGHVPQPVV